MIYPPSTQSVSAADAVHGELFDLDLRLILFLTVIIGCLFGLVSRFGLLPVNRLIFFTIGVILIIHGIYLRINFYSAYMRFADIFKSNCTVPPLHTWRPITQMGGAQVFGAIGLGAAISAFYRRLIRKFRYTILQPLPLECTHVHLVIFIVATHTYSFLS
jgi:hypothetical protein